MTTSYLKVSIAMLLLVAVSGIVAAATVRQGISYQGILTDAAGNPLTGTYSVRFQLYDASTGGTVLSTDTRSVTAANGLFTTAFWVEDPALVDGRAVWLGITVGVDPEMTPRQEIRPVPYALSLRPGAVITGTGTLPTLDLWNTGGGPALNITTTALTSEGISISTTGSGADGVMAFTKGPESTGLYSSTQGSGAEGIIVKTSGTNSEGIEISTTNSDSEGVAVSTSGVGSHGISTETDGDGSHGFSAITSGYGSYGILASTTDRVSHGIVVLTHGQQSYGVQAATAGFGSPGISTITGNDSSPGMIVRTSGESSRGLDIMTMRDESGGLLLVTNGDSSAGAAISTHGQASYAVYATALGTGSYGIQATSNQSTAVYANTFRTDHMWGFYTPDYLYAGGTQVPSPDVAEYMPVSGDAAPGTVLVIGKGGVLSASKAAYDTRVAGIVSTEPGVILGAKEAGNPGEALIAVAGRVPCRVDASYGAIMEGDLLATSGTPGHAMKASDPKIGTILGKAMGTLESGTGTIEVLVTLQ